MCQSPCQVWGKQFGQDRGPSPVQKGELTTPMIKWSSAMRVHEQVTMGIMTKTRLLKGDREIHPGGLSEGSDI